MDVSGYSFACVILDDILIRAFWEFLAQPEVSGYNGHPKMLSYASVFVHTP